MGALVVCSTQCIVFTSLNSALQSAKNINEYKRWYLGIHDHRFEHSILHVLTLWRTADSKWRTFDPINEVSDLATTMKFQIGLPYGYLELDKWKRLDQRIGYKS